MNNLQVVKTAVVAHSRRVKSGWRFTPTHGLVKVFLENGKNTCVSLCTHEMKNYVFEQTGINYSSINLNNDDPLLLMLRMKFDD